MLWWMGETLRRESIRKSGGESPDNEIHPQRNKCFRKEWVLSHCKNSSRGYLESWGRDSSRGQMRWHPSVRVWNSVTFEEHIQLGSGDDISLLTWLSLECPEEGQGPQTPSLPHAHWPLHPVSPPPRYFLLLTQTLLLLLKCFGLLHSLPPWSHFRLQQISPSPAPVPGQGGSIWPWRLCVKWLPGVVSASQSLTDSPRERKHMYSLTGRALVPDSMLMSVLIHIPKWNKEQEPLPENFGSLRVLFSSWVHWEPIRSVACSSGPPGVAPVGKLLSFLLHSAPCLLFCSQHQVQIFHLLPEEWSRPPNMQTNRHLRFAF